MVTVILELTLKISFITCECGFEWLRRRQKGRAEGTQLKSLNQTSPNKYLGTDFETTDVIFSQSQNCDWNLCINLPLF